jgi:hypothetical protein
MISTTRSMLSTAILSPSRIWARSFAAPEVELAPLHHHVVPVVDEVLEQLLQVHDPGHAVVQRQHDDAERRLHLRVLEQLVQHDVRDGVPLQLDDHPHPVPVALVPRSRMSVIFFSRTSPAICSIIRDLFTMYGISWTMIFGPPVIVLLDLRVGPHDQPAPARLVRLPDPVPAVDEPGRWGSRALDVGHEIGDVASGSSMSACVAATTSRRLWGGMFVAIPTAIPVVR